MTHDDPRITAWALGEGTPEERAEVEALLAADPALRAEAEALRDAAGSLKSGLAAEPVPALDLAHRGALEAAMAGKPEVSVHSPRLLRVSPEFGAVAATLLLTLGLALGGATGEVEFGSRRVADAVNGATPNVQVLDGHFANVPGSGEENGTGSGPNAIDGAFSYSADADGAITGVQPDSSTSVDGRILNARGLGGGGGGGGHQFAGRADSDSAWRAGASAGGGGGGAILVKDREAILAARGRGLQKVRLPSGAEVVLTGTLPRDLLHLKTVRLGGVLVPDDSRQPEDPPPPESGAGTPTPPDGGSASGGLEYGLVQDFDVGTYSTESFSPIVENAYVRPLGEAALSTFSIDVDTAAYSIVRRCLVEQNRLPPPGALRIEELVNYFPYSYDGPAGPDPFAVHVAAASCPWNPKHRLVRIVLQGRRIEEPERPAANLVFLLDVSGSMDQPNKLPLVKQSISLLADRLTARDRVGMVVYAGASGLALPSTSGDRKAEILGALERLQAGGSTNGAAGIEQAYQVASENFVRGGINRVVLATDGDFNVGVSDPSALANLVEDKAKSGVFLTALGYGMDNLKDSTLEQLADRGNGNYGYIDNVNEARKVLVDQGMGTLHAIAKDVKIQVEFNPARVAAFRLLGYENRVLAAQDFADDRKDAGEIGAGHTVTAFYEVVPAGEAVPGAPVDALRYQRLTESSGSGESLVVKLRWKEPEGSESTLREVPFLDAGLRFDAADPDFRFGAAVAAFGMVLRDSEHRGDATLALVREIASGALSDDPGGWRGEFLGLVDRAATIKK